jgi:hypothetical protein
VPRTDERAVDVTHKSASTGEEKQGYPVYMTILCETFKSMLTSTSRHNFTSRELGE